MAAPRRRYSILLHQGQESYRDLVTFLDEASAKKRGLPIGSSLLLSRQRLRYYQTAFGELDPRSQFLIADPECERLDQPVEKRGNGRADHGYLRKDVPDRPSLAFVESVLRPQRSLGAKWLVTPWRLFGSSGSDAPLKYTLRCAQLATESKLVAGRKLLLGLEVDRSVFTDTFAWNKMADALIDEGVPDLPLYLRVRVANPGNRKPFAREDTLRGLAAFIGSMHRNERKVLLPRSGLVGWLLAPFGVQVFGVGMDASMNRAQPPGGRGGGGGRKKHWWYFPPLMHFVLDSEVTRIAKIIDWKACACPFCGGRPPKTGADFNPRAAGFHYLWNTAELARELTERREDPIELVRARLRAAADDWTAVQSKGIVLDSRSMPGHLKAWSRVVDAPRSR